MPRACPPFRRPSRFPRNVPEPPARPDLRRRLAETELVSSAKLRASGSSTNPGRQPTNGPLGVPGPERGLEAEPPIRRSVHFAKVVRAAASERGTELRRRALAKLSLFARSHHHVPGQIWPHWGMSAFRHSANDRYWRICDIAEWP